MAVDVALDVEQGVDALHRLQADRREHHRGFALRCPTRAARDVGQHEEFPARMRPAGRFQDRPGHTTRFVELAIAAIGVGLQEPGIPHQVALRMLATAIARVVEHGTRGCRAAERPVVAHVDPEAGDVGPAAGQHRHHGVVAVQPPGGHDMGLQPLEQRHQHGRASADLVSQGRQAERDALAAVALGLAVEWLVLAELLEQDHRQQARPGPTPGDDVERCGWLADALAVTTGELLAHMLDDLPAARHDLERLGDILAQPGQARAATAGAGRRTGDDDALARQVLGERAPDRAGAGEACDLGGPGRGGLGRQLVLGRQGLELLQLQLHLAEQTDGALGARTEAVAVELLDLQPEVRDQRQVAGLLRPGGGDIGERGQERCLERVDVIGQGGRIGVHARSGSRTGPSWYRFEQPTACYPAACGRQVRCGFLQSIPSSRKLI